MVTTIPRQGELVLRAYIYPEKPQGFEEVLAAFPEPQATWFKGIRTAEVGGVTYHRDWSGIFFYVDGDLLRGIDTANLGGYLFIRDVDIDRQKYGTYQHSDAFAVVGFYTTYEPNGEPMNHGMVRIVGSNYQEVLDLYDQILWGSRKPGDVNTDHLVWQCYFSSYHPGWT